jgi:hypothetical protein
VIDAPRAVVVVGATERGAKNRLRIEIRCNAAERACSRCFCGRPLTGLELASVSTVFARAPVGTFPAAGWQVPRNGATTPAGRNGSRDRGHATDVSDP